jgi:transposase-like protein
MSKKDPAEKAIRDIRRKTRRKHSTEEKIRIVLDGLRGEESIAALCRREGIGNVTPADAYFGRHTAIIERRKKIKKLTIQNRRLKHQRQAA